MKETITVEIDSEVQSIIPEFIENRKKDCLRIDSLLEAAAFDEIRILGHRMKGAGGSYGFDDISVIGEAIEKSAMAGNREIIGREVMRLSDYLERVAVVYV